MSNKVKKTIALVSIVFILTVILIVVCLAYFLRDNSVDAYIEYKDNIEYLDIFDKENNLYELKKDDKYKVLIFLSDRCSTCIDALPTIEKLNEIVCKNQNIDLYLLWRNKIPTTKLKKHNLVDCSFSLKNVYIASNYESCFVVDNENVVVFLDNNLNNLMGVISGLNILDKNKLKDNSNTYIKNKYFKNDNGKLDLVCFSIANCNGCVTALSILNSSNSISEKYNFEYITDVKSNQPQFKKDNIDIFKYVYDIQWYPTFLIFNNKDNKYDILYLEDVDLLEETLIKY